MYVYVYVSIIYIYVCVCVHKYLYWVASRPKTGSREKNPTAAGIRFFCFFGLTRFVYLSYNTTHTTFFYGISFSDTGGSLRTTALSRPGWCPAAAPVLSRRPVRKHTWRTPRLPGRALPRYADLSIYI